MCGGASNILFLVSNDDLNDLNMLIFRIYGNIPLDREREVSNMIELSKFDLSSGVVGVFGNGVCYRYVPGNVLSIYDLKSPMIYPLIIKEMAKLHSCNIYSSNNNKNVFIFDKIREFANHLPEILPDNALNLKYQKEYPLKSVIFNEIDLIEKQLTLLKPIVTFTHNDLLEQNLILNYSKDRIHFIDFEYADYNYSAFDIGNHFNEFAGFHGDYSLYPDRKFQYEWIDQYLDCLRTISGDEKKEVDNEIYQWYRIVNKCALLSHLLWSVWSIWQHLHSTIAEIDYLNYAIIRWNEYSQRKDEFLAL